MIQKFADQCAVADSFFIYLLKCQGDSNIEQLEKDELNKENFKQEVFVDSLNSNSMFIVVFKLLNFNNLFIFRSYCERKRILFGYGLY